jgi:hypothetical protein
MILGTEYADITPFLHAGFEVKPEPTLLLDCKPPLTELWAGLRSRSTRIYRVQHGIRRIRRAVALRLPKFSLLWLIVSGFLLHLRAGGRHSHNPRHPRRRAICLIVTGACSLFCTSRQCNDGGRKRLPTNTAGGIVFIKPLAHEANCAARPTTSVTTLRELHLRHPSLIVRSHVTANQI